MKLTNEEFKRFKELSAKVKSKKATPAEEAELKDLAAKRNERGSNDIAWWKNYPELLKDVVNLPFNWIPGTPVSITGPSNASDYLDLGVIAIANIITAIGRSTSDSDAFNSQIRQLWIDMHRKYRGLGSYQKSDLGIAILAIDSFFETLAKFERIYGVINTYHIGNRVVPNGLKDALGISLDLEENLAQFRYTLNLAIEKARQLCLPKGLSMLEADIISLSNIFKDSADRRAFLFAFDNKDYGIYDPTTLSAGGCVKYVSFEYSSMNSVTPSGNAAFNLADIEKILTTQLDALLSDDDITTMCSDLIAAYGPENVMTMQPVPEGYKVEPVQDYERSLQFHNLSIVGNVSTIYESGVGITMTEATAFNNAGFYHVIYQYDNVIKCRFGKGTLGYAAVGSEIHPYYNSGELFPQGKVGEVLFDTWVDTPGETEIMCGSRYCALSGTPIVFDSSKYRNEIVAFGGKLVEQVTVHWYDSATNRYTCDNIDGNVVDNSDFGSRYALFCHSMQMDWFPILYINDSGDLDLFADIDNFTKIDADNLSRLHEVAILSGYRIPMVSKE